VTVASCFVPKDAPNFQRHAGVAAMMIIALIAAAVAF
jgi:hypothetical protein